MPTDKDAARADMQTAEFYESIPALALVVTSLCQLSAQRGILALAGGYRSFACEMAASRRTVLRATCRISVAAPGCLVGNAEPLLSQARALVLQMIHRGYTPA